MNRSLWIPAGCCTLAFAALFATFHRVSGEGKKPDIAQLIALGHRVDLGSLPSPSLESSAPPLPIASGNPPLSIQQAEQVLTRLTDDYLRPWRQRRSSPHRLYSRAMPREIPTPYARVEMASGAAGASQSFAAATIAVSKGTDVERIPCAIDRGTGEAIFFAAGKWHSQQEWLQTATLP